MLDLGRKQLIRINSQQRRRIKFLEEAGKISEGLAAKETEVAKLRLEAKLTENALTKSNKDDLNEAAQLEASVIQLETQRLNLQKRLSTELLTARNEAKKAAEEEPEVIDKKLLKIQEIQEAYRQKQKDKDAETELEKINLEEERKLAELDRLEASETQKQEVIDYYNGLRLDNKKATDKAETDLDKAKKDAFIKNSEAVSGALNGLSALVGENAEAQKGIGIAQAVIDTYVGANKAIAQGGIAGTVAAVGVIASGLANVITIAKTKIPKPKGASGGGSASASTPSISATPTPPSFNVVGATETSVLSDAVAGQTNVPVKAYVVSNDVTTAQSLDNNIIEGATI